MPRDETASTPPKGSSRKSTRGLWISAAAIAVFFFMPALWSTIILFAWSSNSSSCRSSSVRARTSSPARPYIVPANWMNSRAVRRS